MLRSASRLTERRTTTFGCYRLMKYATEIRFPDLRGGVSSRSRYRRCFLKRRVSLNTFQARDVSAVGRRIFSLVLARVERDTSRPDCESQ